MGAARAVGAAGKALEAAVTLQQGEVRELLAQAAIAQGQAAQWLLLAGMLVDRRQCQRRAADCAGASTEVP